MRDYRTLGCLTVLAAGLLTHAHAFAGDAAWCEQEWLKQSAEYADRDVPDYRGLLSNWQQYAKQCSGTVAYEARLAFVYVQLDELDQARKALSGVTTASKYQYLVDLVQALTEGKRLLLDKTVSEPDLQELDRRFMGIVEKYPGHPESYALLGVVESELGRHDAAIRLYEVALEGSRGTQKWGLYRNLTISYAEAERYQAAYDAAGRTMALRKSVTDDKYFVYAVAKAEAGLGKFADAQLALRLIAAKDPSVKQDPDFLQTVDFVFDRMKADQKGTR